MNPNRAGVMLENIREMANGPARLLIQSKRLHDGIAILHERRAGALGKVLKEMSSLGTSQTAFQKIIEDLGMQYRYTWTKEVEGGVLRSDEFKILILPYTQILSDKELDEIKAFVRSGGMVLADLRPATCDWNGKPLAKGALDEVFGIEQDCATARQMKGTMQWTLRPDGAALPAALSAPGMRADGSVKATTAKSTATIADAPAVLVNTFGKGKAVLLNQAPTTYRTLLNRGQAKELRELYRAVLTLGGATRRFQVKDARGEDVAGAELAVFKNGPLEFLTLEKGSLEFEKYPIKATIELDREYEVYNVRTGAKIGKTNRIPVELSGLGCYVYTLLPYGVTGFSVDAPKEVRRGSDATIGLKLAVTDGAPGPHTVRVDVIRPNGERLWPMVKLELSDGAGKVVLPVALNDALGNWTVTATDVATGLNETRKINVVE